MRMRTNWKDGRTDMDEVMLRFNVDTCNLTRDSRLLCR